MTMMRLAEVGDVSRDSESDSGLGILEMELIYSTLDRLA